MPLKTTHDYLLACRVTQRVIDRWDPYSLLASGAPADQFEPVAASIAPYIPRMRSAADAAISEVFSERYEPRYFSREHCLEVGRELFDALTAAGIIDDTTYG